VELYEQETVDVPPDARFALDGQDATSADDAITESVTGPDRPERLARVTVPLPDGAVNEMGDADMLKSRIVTESTTEWMSDPLVAENVTV
jgi:hypothetical protein